MVLVQIDPRVYKLAVWPKRETFYDGVDESPDTKKLYLQVLSLCVDEPQTSIALRLATRTSEDVMRKHLTRWTKQKRLDRVKGTTTPVGGRPPYFYLPPKPRKKRCPKSVSLLKAAVASIP